MWTGAWRDAPCRALRTLIGAAAIAGCADSADAQSLAARGDHFTVDGHPQFLLFISYFDGVRRVPRDRPGDTAILERDLDFFVARGLSGIRVWPNTPQSPDETLMRCDGSLRPEELARLRLLLAQAATRRLMVDLTFTREHVLDAGQPCLTLDDYRTGVVAVARRLIDEPHVLFDLQNEWNVPRIVNDPSPWTAQALLAVRDAVKAVHPDRLVTASTSGLGEQEAARFATTRSEVTGAGWDVLTYHDPREPGWARATGAVVERLRRAVTQRQPGGLPIHLQEPSRCGYDDCAVEHYEIAVREARRAGAAGWTFHHDPDKDLDSDIPIWEMLTPSERDVLTRLRPASDSVPWGRTREPGR
ncbi:MAG: hypothetical protein AB7N65_03640 [Vicinamibacterales bacterium]